MLCLGNVFFKQTKASSIGTWFLPHQLPGSLTRSKILMFGEFIFPHSSCDQPAAADLRFRSQSGTRPLPFAPPTAVDAERARFPAARFPAEWAAENCSVGPLSRRSFFHSAGNLGWHGPLSFEISGKRSSTENCARMGQHPTKALWIRGLIETCCELSTCCDN